MLSAALPGHWPPLPYGPMSGKSRREHPLITGLSNIKTTPKWSFGGRPKELASALNVPGPGSYAVPLPDATSKFTKSARFGFGSASREGSYRKQVPGPGQYSLKKHMGEEGPAFSCTPRREYKATICEPPGPGAHDLPNLVGKEGPKYSGTPRRGELNKANVPGPGAYMPNST